MKQKPVLTRRRAKLDFDAAFEYYLGEAGASVASDFIDSLESALTHLSRNSATGSTRYSFELGLHGLRSWPLKHFPYLIFYADTDTHVEVWRLLHSHADIPKWMHDADD